MTKSVSDRTRLSLFTPAGNDAFGVSVAVKRHVTGCYRTRDLEGAFEKLAEHVAAGDVDVDRPLDKASRRLGQLPGG